MSKQRFLLIGVLATTTLAATATLIFRYFGDPAPIPPQGPHSATDSDSPEGRGQIEMSAASAVIKPSTTTDSPARTEDLPPLSLSEELPHLEEVLEALWATPQADLEAKVEGDSAELTWPTTCASSGLDPTDLPATLADQPAIAKLVKFSGIPGPREAAYTSQLVHHFRRGENRATVKIARAKQDASAQLYLIVSTWVEPFPTEHEQIATPLVDANLGPDAGTPDLRTTLEQAFATLTAKGYERMGWAALVSDRPDLEGTSEEAAASILELRNARIVTYDYGLFHCARTRTGSFLCNCREAS